MKAGDRVWVAGADTLIGAAIVRALRRAGWEPLAEPAGLDLTASAAVDTFFTAARPEYVFVAGGKSGGIRANQKHPATLMLDNLLLAANVISAAHRHGAHKLLYLASSCTYPRLAAQPMQPAALLTGPLEPTNEAYAVAKLAGLKLCQAYAQEHGAPFITAIPANPFGPGDDYDLEDAHVIGALLHRMHLAHQAGAPEVEIWGTGKPQREFIYADDLADACLFVMQRYAEVEPINLGAGQAYSIAELAEQVRAVVGYSGALRFNPAKPDGMPIKVLDSGPLRDLGWQPRTPFPAALVATYADFLKTTGAKIHD